MDKTKLLVITGLFCADRELLSLLEQPGLDVQSAPEGVCPDPVAPYPEGTRFLFVYQPPWVALGNFLRDQESFRRNPEAAASYWLDYYRGVINFFTRHRNTGLLINTAYPESTHSGLIAAMNSHFGWDLQNAAMPPAEIADRRGMEFDLHAWFLGQIAPDCIELYVELESCADLLGRQPDFDCQKQLLTLPEAPVFFGTWAAQLQRDNDAAAELAKLERDLAAATVDNRSLRHQLDDLSRSGEQVRVKWEEVRLAMEGKLKQLRDLEIAHAEISKLQNETQVRLKETGQEAERKHKEMSDKLAEHEQESELLLLQLHQVQEELEHYFLENQRLETKLAESQKQLEQDRQQIKERDQLLEQSRRQLEQNDARLRDKDQQLARLQTLYSETSGLLGEYQETLKRARYSLSTLYKNRRVIPEQTMM